MGESSAGELVRHFGVRPPFSSLGGRTTVLLRAWLDLVARVKELPDERGATAVEYAVVASLIAAVTVVAVHVVGEKTSGNFESVNQLWNA